MTALDPDAAAWLERLRQAGAPPLSRQTPEQAREAHVAAAAVASAPGDPAVEARDEVRNGVPVRVYVPERPVGTTVYVHGGGWVVGTLDTYDGVCRALARRSGSTVVSAAYDLAPEARHPHQVEQVRAVLAGVLAPGPDGPVAAAGDSAGAHLVTLAAALAPRPPLAALALVYPVVAPGLDLPSARENAEGCALTTDAMRWYWRQYLPEGYLPEQAGPVPVGLLDLDLAGLPPTLVLTAGFDPLRDEGLALADALEAAGVPVRRSAYDGQIHGFFRMDAVIGEARRAQDEVGSFLREHLRS